MSSAKRVVLKSPVREFRTPGSVRGQLGNWLSYLDHVPHKSLKFSSCHLHAGCHLANKQVSARFVPK